MERRGRLPVAEAVRYIIQVAAGLDHAASRGVVHRDIKPSNIIITPNGAGQARGHGPGPQPRAARGQGADAVAA